MSGGNKVICQGVTVPSLTASVNTNETIDWYNAAINGALLLQGSLNYTPTVSGTYYAEARNTITGCKSSSRTVISLSINLIPTLSVISTTCSADLLTYSISFSSNGTVSSTKGIVDNINKIISGIPKDSGLIMTSALNMSLIHI